MTQNTLGSNVNIKKRILIDYITGLEPSNLDTAVHVRRLR